MIPKDILIPIPIHIVYDSGKSRGEFGVIYSSLDEKVYSGSSQDQ